jgi:hypothetical protein
MPSNNRQSSQRPSGEMRRTAQSPLKLPPDSTRRQVPLTEDDYLAEDDPLSNPPRTSTSAIRLRPLPAGQRGGYDGSVDTTRQQGAVPRRAGAGKGQTSSAYPGPVPPRSGRTATHEFPPVSAAKVEKRNMHWLLYVGVGMVAALALWVSLSSLLAWGTAKYNDIVYGYPRFYQTDAVVGHNDSQLHPSHFIALNLKGQVIVIELPGGNPAKSVDYIGPDLIATGDDLIPITLSFQDKNHDGKPDMIIQIQDRDVIFCNDGTKFTACNLTGQ